jgi:hypothetical protein
VARGTGWALLGVALVACAALLALLLWSRTPAGERALLVRLVPRLQEKVQGRLTVARLGGSLTRTLHLGDVRIYDTDGHLAIALDELDARYDLGGLLRGRLDVSELRLRGARVYAHRLADGQLNLARLIRSQPEQPSGSAFAIHVARLDAQGELALEPRAGEPPVRATLRLEGSFDQANDRLDARVTALTVESRAPLRASLEAHGGLTLDGGAPRLHGVSLTLHTDGRELDPLLAPLGVRAHLRGPLEAELRGDGELGALRIALAVRPARGELTAEGRSWLTLRGKLAWEARVRARGLDPGALVEEAPHAHVEGDARVRGENARATVELERLRAELSGARALARGRFSFGGERAGELTAEVNAPDLSRLALYGLPALVGQLDAHARVELAGTHTRIDADVSAARLGVAAARVRGLRAQVHALDFQGSAHLSALDVDLPYAAGEVGPRGAADLAPRKVHLDRVELSADGDRRHLALALEAAGPRGAIASLRAHGVPIEGRGRYSTDLSIDRLILGLEDQRWRSPAPGRLRVDERAATLTLALLSDSAARLALRARVGRPASGSDRPLRAELDLRDFELAELRRLLPPRFAALGGRVGMHARLSGSQRAPELTLQLDASELRTDDRQRTRVRLDAALRKSRLSARLDAALRAAGAPAGQVSAELVASLRGARPTLRQVLRMPLALTVHGEQLELAQLPLERLGMPTPPSRGKVDVALTLDTRSGAPAIDLRLDGKRLSVGPLDGVDLHLRADYQRTLARAELDATNRGASLLTAHAESRFELVRLLEGRVSPDVPLSATLDVPRFDLSRLSRAGGTLSAKLQVHGTLARPIGSAELRGNAVKYDRTLFSRVAARAEFDGQLLTARLELDEPPSGTVRLAARVPLASDSPVEATLDARGLALALSELGALRRLDGRIDAALRVSGTRAQPHLDGSLSLEHGALSVGEEGPLYQDLTAALRIADGVVRLDKLSVAVAGGSLSASGKAKLAGLVPAQLDLTADAKNFPLRIADVGAWLDARAALKAETRDHRLIGTLTISDGTAHLGRLSSRRRLQPTGPLADVVFVDARAVRRRRARERAVHASGPARVELTVRVPGVLKLRSPEVRTDLRGELDIKLAGVVPKISGHVESTWGNLELLGRRYEIETARFGFDGRVEVDPQLDVRVTRQLSNATVVIEVHGTAKKPELALASDPPIYDSSQIVGIILSGDPGDQRIDTRNTDQKVVGALSGLLVNQIKNQIAPGLPVDVIRVDAAAGASAGALGATRVEFGKYVTDTVYLSYVHQFGTPTGLRRINANEASIEYRFKRHFQIASRFGDAGAGQLNFYYTLHY